MNNYNIESSFHLFYQNCINSQSPGIKVVAFPTGMGKTYGAANNAIKIAQDGNIPVFIAPRIAILKDFENTVTENNKKIEVVRIIADTELKQIEYYYNNLNNLKKIVNNIDNELLQFIKNNKVQPLYNVYNLEDYFNSFTEKEIKSKKDIYNIFRIFKAIKNIKEIYEQFNSYKNNIHQEEIKMSLNSKLWKVYNGIIDIFEASNFFYIQNKSHIYIDNTEIYKIYGFNSIDKQIVKDFFGLSFALADIHNKENHYIFTITSKKSLKYISRTFEVQNNKLKKITGNENNKLFFNTYINTFCHKNNLTSIYYIDESDEFYNEIVEDKTKVIFLNNFLFKIKTFFDYSNISSLLSFIKKIENNKKISHLANDFKETIFNYNDSFLPDKIEECINLFESHKLDFNPMRIVDNQTKFSKKLFTQLNNMEKTYSFSSFWNDIGNNTDENRKVHILFLFICFLDSLGISDKINQLKNNEKNTNKLLLGDLYKTINNSKEFIKAWHEDKNNNFTLDYKFFFKELANINSLLISSHLGETIIKNEDFIELAENNKFMFGNDNLSLVEEQIKYLNNLISVESFSDNALLEIHQNNKSNNAITLSYIFSFLTKVLIRTIQDIRVQNEEYEEGDEERTLDKEISCHTYLKKMKTSFAKIKKIENSQFKIKDENLLFDENYIFNQDKNIINLFTTNYDKNIKFGKPDSSSYIQMSNIQIKDSPEKELLNYFSIIEDNEIVDFKSKSIIFLMSATSTINSYYGNFDYEYLYKQFILNNILYDTSYINDKDITLVNEFKKPYINKNTTQILCFDYGIYQYRDFQLYTHFELYMKNSSNKSIDILRNEYNKYKLYEFQSFVYSIENLFANNINSLFFISQTTSHIISFLNAYISDSLNNCSKLIRKFNQNNKDYNGIFIIDKKLFNLIEKNHYMDKDLIIIFYDAKFENKQKATINSIENDNSPNDVFVTELDSLDSAYNNLKKEIFNEDKYKILLCSSFCSISKGFNFVTNKNNQDKDFDAINIGMDRVHKYIKIYSCIL